MHDLVGVGGVEADREGVDAGELLEQAALALHHRHRRVRADVAEAEHGGAVGYHGDRVALDRVLECLVDVLGDRQADPRDAGRVGHREVVARLQWMLVVLFDLAADVQQEGAVGRVDDLSAVGRLDRRDDAVPVLAVGGVDDDVAQAVAAVDLDEVDRSDHRTGVADRRGHQSKDALCVVELDADGEAILRARCGAHGIVLLAHWRQGMLGGIREEHLFLFAGELGTVRRRGA